jgi:outer membrane protein TolC
LSVHGRIKQAIGPFFLWLQINEAETRCVVRLGERAFPPILLPVGLSALVPPPRGLGASRRRVEAPAEPLQPLRGGALLSDTTFRAEALKAIRPGLQPVTDLLGSLRRQARAVPAVILDAAPSDIPGLRETFQELFPDQPVFLLQDLRLDATEDGATGRRGDSATGRGLSSRQDHLAPLGGAPPSPNRPVATVHPVAWLALFAVFGFAVLGVLGLQRMDLMRGDLAGVAQSVTAMRHDALGRLPLPVPVSVRPMIAPHLPQPAVRPTTTSSDQRPVTRRDSRVAIAEQAPSAGLATRDSRRVESPAQRAPALAAPHPTHSAAHLVRRPSAVRIEVLDLTPAARPAQEGSARHDARSSVAAKAGGRRPPVARLSVASSPSPAVAGPQSRSTEPRPGTLPSHRLAAEPPRSTAQAPAATPMVVTPVPAPGESQLPELPPMGRTISSPVAARLTLPELLRRVVANDLEVQAATCRRDGREAISRSAVDRFRPQGSLEGGIFSQSPSMIFGEPERSLDMAGKERGWGGLFGAMEIDAMGQRHGLKRSAAAVRQRGAAAVDVARERAAYEAALTYLDALEAATEVEARQELLTMERENWDAVQARLARGDVSRLDVAQAMNRVATAQSHLAAALAHQEVAELSLGASLRVASGSRVQPDPSDTWLTAQVTRLASQPAQASALASAEVLEAGARVEECRALASLARTNDTLFLSAHGGVSFSGSDASRPDALVGLRLSLPFADKGARRMKLRETQTMLEEAMALHQKSVERATAEIVATQVELLRSRERLASTGAAVAAAREAVRLARLRYQAGFAPLADLLQAQTQLGVALLDRTALQDGERRSQVELLRRTGQLLRSSAPV